MTLDEAIKEYQIRADENKEDAKYCRKVYGSVSPRLTADEERAEEYGQLVKWLKDYKRLKYQEEQQHEIITKKLWDDVSDVWKSDLSEK